MNIVSRPIWLASHLRAFKTSTHKVTLHARSETSEKLPIAGKKQSML